MPALRSHVFAHLPRITFLFALFVLPLWGMTAHAGLPSGIPPGLVLYDTGITPLCPLAFKHGTKILVVFERNTDPVEFDMVRFDDNGILDLTFGTDGQVSIRVPTNFNISGFVCITGAIQPDGKIVLSGQINSGNTTKIVTVRLLQTGQLDDSLGTNGITIFAPEILKSSYVPYIYQHISVDSTNRIITAGTVYAASGIQGLIFRLTETGNIDPTFNTSAGSLIGSEFITSLAIQLNDKLLLGGYNEGTGTFVLRLNTDGSLDLAFADNGIRFLPTPLGYYMRLPLLNTDSQGRIIAICANNLFSSNPTPDLGSQGITSIYRLDSGGTLDPAFINGQIYNFYVQFPVLGQTYYYGLAPFEQAIDANGIRLVGNSYSYLGVDYLNNDGTLNSTFGSSGLSVWKAVMPFDNSDYILPLSSAVFQADGSTVILGRYMAEFDPYICNWITCYHGIYLLRFNPDGSIDETFGTPSNPCPTSPAGLNKCDPNLQKGDIILSHSLNITSIVEAQFFAGYWSHAGIYNGDGTITESYPTNTLSHPFSDLPGVVINPVEKSLFWDKSVNDWAILRVNSLNSTQQGNAVAYAEGKADGNHLYNYAFGDKLTESKFYCSQLVWRAYETQGVDLDSNYSAFS